MANARDRRKARRENGEVVERYSRNMIRQADPTYRPEWDRLDAQERAASGGGLVGWRNYVKGKTLDGYMGLITCTVEYKIPPKSIPFMPGLGVTRVTRKRR